LSFVIEAKSVFGKVHWGVHNDIVPVDEGV
jgi:hypothetical protein